MRVSRITNNRRFDLEFTNEMNFPGIAEFKILNEGRRLESGKKKVYLDIKMISVENEVLDENLVSWSIESVSSRKIGISLEFNNALEVSQGDEPE